MINTDDFIKRLEMLLEYYSISPSAFADKIGVQRSGMSHLLSGRNKPSLDFILKISENYPEVNLYWLLNGKGNFLKNDTGNDATIAAVVPPTPAKKEVEALDLFSDDAEKSILKKESNKPEATIPPTILDGDIERIVVFYSNGTFKSYNQAK